MASQSGLKVCRFAGFGDKSSVISTGSQVYKLPFLAEQNGIKRAHGLLFLRSNNNRALSAPRPGVARVDYMFIWSQKTKTQKRREKGRM